MKENTKNHEHVSQDTIKEEAWILKHLVQKSLIKALKNADFEQLKHSQLLLDNIHYELGDPSLENEFWQRHREFFLNHVERDSSYDELERLIDRADTNIEKLFNALDEKLVFYGYRVDLDEAGGFLASVINAKGKTVFNVKDGEHLEEGESNIIENGFMNSKDDLEGLTEYLRNAQVIPCEARVLEMPAFERYLEDPDDFVYCVDARENKFFDKKPVFFGYRVDLDDHRGFQASVINYRGKTVFSVRDGGILEKGEFSVIKSGFICSKDDLIGLQLYLRAKSVIPSEARVLRMSEFNRYLENPYNYSQEMGAKEQEGEKRSSKPIIPATDQEEDLMNIDDEKPAFYGYYIDLDERGYFEASVRNAKGKTVFSIRDGDSLEANETSIFEDGFMRHQNDLKGLTEYLRDLQIIPSEGRVLEMSAFERHLENPDDDLIQGLSTAEQDDDGPIPG